MISLRQRIANYIAPKAGGSHTRRIGLTTDLVDDAWKNITASSGSIIVTAETSLKFSAVWAAIRILSEIPASLPKCVQYYENGGWTDKKEDPIAYLLDYPNELMTGFDFHELMNGSLHLHGNAVAIIYRDRNGYANQLLPISWQNIIPSFYNGAVFYKINDALYSINETFSAQDILHYKLFAYNGLVGRNPIALARDNITLALSAEQYGTEFFDKGGNHKGVIETTAAFKSYGEYSAWREKYDNEHSGYGNNHGTPILQPGMTYKQLTMSMQDAQFIATRQFSLNDISRWFNIPPHLIGELSRATFSNIEHQDLQFIKYSLRGVVRRQEDEWEMKLFPVAMRKNVRVKFNLDGLARGDMAARSTYVVNMVNGGILTPNEGREVESLPPVAGGDEIRIPANIVGNVNNTPNGTATK